MKAHSLQYAGDEQALRRFLAEVPLALAGLSAGNLARQVANACLQAVATEAATIIKDAFVVKARGGTDAAGVRWAPLARETLAYSRRHPTIGGPKGAHKNRPLLTAAQDRVWRRIFYSLAIARGGDHAEAAATAWVVVKAMGGRTLLEESAGQPHEIGRDTGRLLASLSPGGPHFVLTVSPPRAFAGTNVAYADKFDDRRPIWPKQWPDVWLQRLGQAFGDALAAALRIALPALAAGGGRGP